MPVVLSITVQDSAANAVVQFADGTQKTYRFAWHPKIGLVEPLTSGFERDLIEWDDAANEITEAVGRAIIQRAAAETRAA